MGEIGKDHRGSSGATSLLRQGHPRAQDCVPTLLEFSSEGDCATSLGKLFQCSVIVKEVLPYVQVELLCPLSLVPIAWPH